MTSTNNQELKPFLRKKTIVAISGFSEMLTSLHVLQRPEHHLYRIQWAADVQSRLPNKLANKICQMGQVSDEWVALLDADTPATANQSIEEAIADFAKLPDAEFIEIVFNQRYPLSRILGWLTGSSHDWKILLTGPEKEVLASPRKYRHTIVEVLEDYYELIFRDEWQLIEPWLVRAERQFFERLEKNSVAAINELHPRISVHEDAIHAQKAAMYRFPYSELRKILVRPSTFVYPHLLIGCRDQILYLPLSVEVPGTARKDSVPSDMVRMFKVLGDETRLRIVRYLFKQPHCTQQLAHLLSISEAAVSKHLKLLAEADFVSAERRGNYLFYALKPREVEMILVYLRQFLEQ